jgi:hypothetical protein
MFLPISPTSNRPFAAAVVAHMVSAKSKSVRIGIIEATFLEMHLSRIN